VAPAPKRQRHPPPKPPHEFRLEDPFANGS
jgi:hypothetical protein